MCRTIAALALALSVATPSLGTALRAQESILLRYHPSERMAVRTVSWTNAEARMALGGFMAMVATLGRQMVDAFGGDTADLAVGDSLQAKMGAAAGDSMTLQLALEYHLLEQVTEARDGRYVVYRAVDSTVARTRSEGRAWQPARPDEYPYTAAEIVLDDRYHVVDFAVTTPRNATNDNLAAVLRAPYGGFAVELPAEPVSPGTTWITDGTMPFNMGGAVEPGDAPAPTETGDIATRTWVTLDSLVDRGTDTLAYLRVRGRLEGFTDGTADPAAPGSGTVDGTFGGRMIWSTAWNAFVAGTSRATFTVEFQFGPTEDQADPEPVRIGMRFDITNRFQVRL